MYIEMTGSDARMSFSLDDICIEISLEIQSSNTWFCYFIVMFWKHNLVFAYSIFEKEDVNKN